MVTSISHSVPKTPSHSDAVAVNPPEKTLGAANAILSGTSNHYYVPDYEGCLSIKSVICGSATWEAGGRRFVVHENSYLVLNDHQHYTMTVDSARKVTTFCLFFERGFVEDVFRGTVTAASTLLESAQLPKPFQLGFMEKLEPRENTSVQSLWDLRRRITANANHQFLEDDFYRIARELVQAHHDTNIAAARLPAARSSTRHELYRRVLRGRDYILSSLDQPIRLADIAEAACLSPYHFHRAFTHATGETPQQFLTRQRLQKAKVLLQQADRSVTEVCFESGFESLGSFSTLFRRRFGVSPREFGNKNKR